MTEKWVDVRGYESYYQVSDMGRVRSKDRTVACSRTGTRTLKGKLLTLNPDSAGYCKVKFQDQGRNEVWKVHRLVATHFLEKVDGKDYINHIDNNRSNNVVTNLEWCTPQENTQHMHVQGRNYAAFGADNASCKLSDEQVKQIRQMAPSHTQAHIASVFGIARQTVGQIISGKRRSTVG